MNDSTERPPFVSLSSDFGIQSEGVGVMKAMVLRHCPLANVIDLTHGIASFSLVDGAREMETAEYLPVGIHVCVVDPGVGSQRWPVALETSRGDILIGPNNGVLIPAVKKLGGIIAAIRLDSKRYFRPETSRTFAGRDIFSAAAGHLASGIPLKELGTFVEEVDLIGPPFDEATLLDGGVLATVIHVNKYGSAILNVKEVWLDSIGFIEGTSFEFRNHNGSSNWMFRRRTFSDVGIGEDVLVPDDYGRVELATNQGSFIEKYELSIGDVAQLIPSKLGSMKERPS